MLDTAPTEVTIVPMSTQSHYEVLGVRHDATPETIRDAYRRAVVASHPDAGPPADREWRERRTVELNIAYTVLKDPGKRADYDERLRALLSPAEPTEEATPAPPATPTRSDSTTRPRPRATRSTATSTTTRLAALRRVLATPVAGWTLVSGAALLGNALGGIERGIDAFLWAALAHQLFSLSSKSPLASMAVGAFRILERMVSR